MYIQSKQMVVTLLLVLALTTSQVLADVDIRVEQSANLTQVYFDHTSDLIINSIPLVESIANITNEVTDLKVEIEGKLATLSNDLEKNSLHTEEWFKTSKYATESNCTSLAECPCYPHPCLSSETCYALNATNYTCGISDPFSLANIYKFTDVSFKTREMRQLRIDTTERQTDYRQYMGNTVVMSADGLVMGYGRRYKSTGSDGGCVVIWSRNSTEYEWRYDHLVEDTPLPWMYLFGEWPIEMSGDGNTLIGRTNNVNEGVYVFNRPDRSTNMVFLQKLLPSDSQDDWGHRMAINHDGTVLAIAMVEYTWNNVNNPGAVHVFTLDVGGTEQYEFLQELRPTELLARFQYGAGLSLSPDGSKLAIGNQYAAAAQGKLWFYDFDSINYVLSDTFEHTMTELAAILKMSAGGTVITTGSPNNDKFFVIQLGDSGWYLHQTYDFMPGTDLSICNTMHLSGDGLRMLCGDYTSSIAAGGRVVSYQRNDLTEEFKVFENYHGQKTKSGFFGSGIACDTTGAYCVAGHQTNSDWHTNSGNVYDLNPIILN